MEVQHYQGHDPIEPATPGDPEKAKDPPYELSFAHTEPKDPAPADNAVSGQKSNND